MKNNEIKDQVDWENLQAALLKILPELKNNYEKERAWWGSEEPGNHIVFGDVLFPFIEQLVKSPENKALIKKIFDFVEALANHQDEKIQEVICVTLCEDICDDLQLYNKTQEFMGPRTKSFCESILKSGNP